MKKTLIIALLAGLGFGALAETQYKVYDVKMTLNTTKAGGIASTSCGDNYVYRDPGKRVINGVIAGCGCIAMAGDESCENFEVYFWDATTKTQLTNFTFKTELLQRIGKKGQYVEQFATFTVEDQEGEMFDLQLVSATGKYTASKRDPVYDTISVSGHATGTVDAPYKTTRGSCTACSTTPDTVDQTQAVAVCEEGVCTPSDASDVTTAHGTYSMKYNASKSKKAEKSGVTAKTLGLPAYVKLAD